MPSRPAGVGSATGGCERSCSCGGCALPTPWAGVRGGSRNAMVPVAHPPSEIRVAVFAKAPIPGEVKTRLHGILGPEGAAALQAGLVRHALSTALAAGIGPVELHCAPDEHHDFFIRCAE